VGTAQADILYGQLPASYDRAANRWIPSRAMSLDGLRYAYMDYTQPMQNQLHVVDVATGADRKLTLPPGPWAAIAFTKDGIYIHTSYEGIGLGLWLVNPDSGDVQELFTDKAVDLVTGSTAWIEGVDGPGLGEWIRFDFDREINLHRILIQPGYFKSPAIWAENNRIQTLTAYFSDGTSRDLTFTDRMDSQKVDIGSVRTKWVKFVIKSVYYGTDPDTAISEVAFEWD